MKVNLVICLLICLAFSSSPLTWQDNRYTKCDDLTSRLDDLNNISPTNYGGDDPKFPRNAQSIGKGDAAYGDKGNSWIKMHDVSRQFSIFGDSIRPRDVNQGSLGNCYMLAAIASLANIRGGQPIKDAFITKTDNSAHVYTTKWLVDGKPRTVSVDEWIPGKNGRASMSKVAGDHDFWAIILEKAWAKIHGSYMITEAGWHTKVWAALTSASTFKLMHKEKSADELYQFIKSLLDNEYAVGSATVAMESGHTNLVGGHAYSVLDAYEVYTDRSNRYKQKLIRVFNPWNSERWSSNPWADGSRKWNDHIRSQIPNDLLNHDNDGSFWLTPEDYKSNFGLTNWAEVRKDYSIAWQDRNFNGTGQKTYTSKFNVKQGGKDIYVQIEEPNQRLYEKFDGCNAPFSLKQLSVKTPSGKTLNSRVSRWRPWGTANVQVLKIENAQAGDYEITTSIDLKEDFHKYFTFTVYGPNNNICFGNQCNGGQGGGDDQVNPNPSCKDDNKWCSSWAQGGHCKANQQVQEICKKSCNKCNDVVDPCEGINCGANGSCQAGKCQCRNGFSGSNCQNKPQVICKDNNQYCSDWAQGGYCSKNSYVRQNCKKSCNQC